MYVYIYFKYVCREGVGLGLDSAHTVECPQEGYVSLWSKGGKGGAFAGGEDVVEIDAYRSCI